MLYILVLMPQARARHQPEMASKMANRPATTKIKPHKVISPATMMPATRHSPPMTPRAMRPFFWMLRRKKLTRQI